jgi:hypothetical protein
MDTDRVTRRARHTPFTRWLVVVTAVCAFALLSGCAGTMAEGVPEVIPYCSESAGVPVVDSPPGCIQRP